jgi:hypothetical protein
MPITGQGWEMLIRRTHEQRRESDGKRRTIGTYQVFHGGTAVPALSGVTAESAGPGSNAVAGNEKRVEARRYPLFTQAGIRYVTFNFSPSENQNGTPKPGIELQETGNRSEILIHPGNGFLSSVGCINLARSLPTEEEPISYAGSRRRVIALIEDMKVFLGAAFPMQNGRRIPDAHVVIDGEPPAPA